MKHALFKIITRRHNLYTPVFAAPRPFLVPSSICQIARQGRSFATMTRTERLTDHLEAPELDDRSYRVIRLPNKLEALLVHDADTDKASASVNVNVGSFSDAEDMPGMAHAVEHLLFMGTKKVLKGILARVY